MTTPKSLPARPSQDSLRKQAKKLAREIAAGDANAIARARAQLPDAELPLSQRDAQLVLAREYGYAGWQELSAEVQRRLGQGIEWAASQAQRAIHDNDVEALKRLLTEHPALLSWRGGTREGGLLGMATHSYGDSDDPERERQFTRAACAELLIDAGAVVVPDVCDGLIESRARGLLQLFERKHLLPRSLKFRTALGDIDAVRACVAAGENDAASLNEAFTCACHFEHGNIATFLLDRLIALDAHLGSAIDAGPGRAGFIDYLVKEHAALAFIHATPDGPWQAFIMRQIVCAIRDDDLPTFVRGLKGEPLLLGDSCVGFQVGLIGRATLQDRGAFISALLDMNPALLRIHPPPPSAAIELAFTYAKTHLLPLLTRVWPIPDDLPHAAGLGDLDKVKKWIDASGKPDQQVLDTAFAWAVLNHHFQVADFLLEHGADINTHWGSHEPASILHELVFHDDYEAMQFLIDRGIDMTIKDYRWGATAQGWAYHAAKNQKLAQWLGEAEQRRKGGS